MDLPVPAVARRKKMPRPMHAMWKDWTYHEELPSWAAIKVEQKPWKYIISNQTTTPKPRQKLGTSTKPYATAT
jgi:hypothetical protein